MARKKHGDAGGVDNSWLVTFSDCMTLLLCFFVLLLSFSSFDERSRSRLGMAFKNKTFDSIFTRRSVTESFIETDERPVDHTDKGSTRRRDADPRPTRRFKIPPNVDNADAYAPRRIFRIPSDELFVPSTSLWKQGAEARLAKLAEFLRLLPCTVTVGETRTVRPGQGTHLGVERACAVMDYLAKKGKVPSDRLCLRSSDSGAVARFTHTQPTIEVELLDKGMME